MAEDRGNVLTPWLAATEGDRTRALFDAVLQAEPAARRGILEEARRVCPEAAEEVESLLEYHDQESGLLDEGAPAAAARLAGRDGAPIPERIGRYVIVREIGHGGMGVVYEATQEFPKRRVALKVIRPELVSRSLLRRFEHEAEALAAMEHPAIARLYEAGFDTCRPSDGSAASTRVAFIAMELVCGRTLTEACEGLDLAAKVELLAQVCDAVDHAHRRGVIHRDLKPGNIFVDQAGSPKVLDFGIAKLADTAGPAHPVETRAGQIVGTLGYMSPEQLSGDARALDCRCDIYSLGVLVYQCLSGSPPVDVTGLQLMQAAAAVRDHEPTPLGRRDTALRGDLEAIAAKALEKDRDRRYSSAGELAADLRRFLRHEPVSARPLTAFYHAGKFASRHRGMVAALTAIVVSLAGGAAAFAWQAAQAHDAARTARAAEAAAKLYAAEAEKRTAEAKASAAEAKDRAAEADRVRVFLWNMLETATPEIAKGKVFTMRQAVDDAERKLAADATMTPPERAEIHNMLGRIYVSLYEHAKALFHYGRYAEIQESLRGPDHTDAIHARLLTIWPLAAIGRKREAFDLASSLLERSRRVLGEADENTVDLYSSLAVAASPELGLSRDEVLRIQLQSCEKTSAHYGPESVEADRERMNYGVTLMNFGDLDRALPILAECLRWRRATLGDDHPSVLVALSNYGGALSNANRFAEAAEILDEAVLASDRIIGRASAPSAKRRRDLAMARAQSGNPAECERLMRMQLELVPAMTAPSPDDRCAWRGLMIAAIVQQGRLNEADREITAFYNDCLREFGPSDPRTIQVVTLEFDLREALHDPAGMKRCAERLKGTPWGEAAMKQAIDAENAASN